MALFDWDPSYSVHVPQFDDDHQELISLLNEAHRNYMAKASLEETRLIIDRLVDYVHFHFAAEENWMILHGYGGLAEHTAEHDHLSRQLSDLQADIDRGSKQLTNELFSFLKNWLFEHILATDAAYGKFAVSIGKAASRHLE